MIQQHEGGETEKGSSPLTSTPQQGAPQLVRTNYHLRTSTNGDNLLQVLLNLNVRILQHVLSRLIAVRDFHRKINSKGSIQQFISQLLARFFLEIVI